MSSTVIHSEKNPENLEEFIDFHRTWVGPLVHDQCKYYQDRDKQFEFYTRAEGWELLNKMLDINEKIFRVNDDFISAYSENRAQTVDEGKSIYVEKMTLNKGEGTWSQEEYGHPGFQRMYLHIKSFRGLTETWAMLERAAAAGIFDIHQTSDQPVTFASICGGPGHELLAVKLFFSRFSPEVELDLFSLDLCPSWEPYTPVLGIQFRHWDANCGDLLQAINRNAGQLTYVLISYGLAHCSKPNVLDMYQDLLFCKGVRAILITERSPRLVIEKELEQRSIHIVKLMEQTYGRDDRQIALVSNLQFVNLSAARNGVQVPNPVFPNNPYSLQEFVSYYRKKDKKDPNSRQKLHPCSDFLKKGACVFGDRCRYAHTDREFSERGQFMEFQETQQGKWESNREQKENWRSMNKSFQGLSVHTTWKWPEQTSRKQREEDDNWRKKTPNLKTEISQFGNQKSHSRSGFEKENWRWRDSQSLSKGHVIAPDSFAKSSSGKMHSFHRSSLSNHPSNQQQWSSASLRAHQQLSSSINVQQDKKNGPSNMNRRYSGGREVSENSVKNNTGFLCSDRNNKPQKSYTDVYKNDSSKPR